MTNNDRVKHFRTHFEGVDSVRVYPDHVEIVWYNDRFYKQLENTGQLRKYRKLASEGGLLLNLAHYCGYVVMIDNTEKLLPSSYFDADVEAYGGLTFSETVVVGGIRYVCYGFDCNHGYPGERHLNAPNNVNAIHELCYTLYESIKENLLGEMSDLERPNMKPFVESCIANPRIMDNMDAAS